MEDQTNKVKLSVIIPVYNIDENSLHRCIRSIIKQNVKIEVILVDDGSDYICHKVCDDLAKEYTDLVVIHQLNEGVSSARNKGLSNAHGEYIAFVDADDWIEDGMYHEMLLAAEKNDFDIVISGFVRDYDGIIKNKVSCCKKITLTSKEALYELLKKEKIGWEPWDKIFKKEIVENLFFNTNYAMGEDLDFVWRCVKKSHQIYILPLHKYHYCYRNDSVTSEINPVKKNDGVLVMRKILQDCRENYPMLVNMINSLLIKEMSSVILKAYMVNKCKRQIKEYQNYIRGNYILLLKENNLSVMMKVYIFFLSCNYMFGWCLIKMWKMCGFHRTKE